MDIPSLRSQSQFQYILKGNYYIFYSTALQYSRDRPDSSGAAVYCPAFLPSSQGNEGLSSFAITL